jgi:hypothetical protein
VLCRGNPLKKPLHIYQAETDEAGRLTVDYLLVTKLPNLLAPVGRETKFMLVMFSGSHGTGSRASTLLVSHDPRSRQLLRLVKQLVKEAGSPWFQALFRVRLSPGDERRSTESRVIEPAVQRGSDSSDMMDLASSDRSWFSPIRMSPKACADVKQQLAHIELLYPD